MNFRQSGNRAQDHIFEVNRGDLQDKEKLVGTPAPPVLEYDSDGNLVNTLSYSNLASLLRALNPFQNFVDMDKNMAEDIIQNAKYLKQ